MRKILDYTISKEELRSMSEYELADLLMYTDRDRKDFDVAEKIYWWCVEEINRRLDSGEISEYQS